MISEVQYGAMVALGACIAFMIRRAESRRLGYTHRAGYRYVGLFCIFGAIAGARAGMFFYEAPTGMEVVQEGLWNLGFDGKTVLGALTGGYIFGELGKKVVGVGFSTGDALAIALPVGQAFGRLGCYFAGCCYGTPLGHTGRHPVQLYESGLCLVLAAVLFAIRRRPRPAGHLFRYYLIGYAAIRFSTEFFRGEPQLRWGALSVAQIYCLVMGLAFAASILRRGSTADRTGS